MHYFIKEDENRFSNLQKDILADSYQDWNHYPKKLQGAYDMIHHHTPYITTTYHRRANGIRNVNVIFTQHQTPKDQGNPQGQKQVPGTDGRITDNLFFKWNGYSHIAWYWRSASDTYNSTNETEQLGCTGVSYEKNISHR